MFVGEEGMDFGFDWRRMSNSQTVSYIYNDENKWNIYIYTCIYIYIYIYTIIHIYNSRDFNLAITSLGPRFHTLVAFDSPHPLACQERGTSCLGALTYKPQIFTTKHQCCVWLHLTFTFCSSILVHEVTTPPNCWIQASWPLNLIKSH